jgi:hypothetical protein
MALYPNRWAKESKVWDVERPACHCLDAQYSRQRWRALSLHSEVQDTDAPAWNGLLELIEQAAADGREEFSPAREMDPRDWAQIVALPSNIAKLKSVKHLIVYGSSLVRIPPEIGEMSSLEQFTPYTSYRLHWFPFEITRCKRLKRSTVSTRALYGNYKFRPPFPRLPQLLQAMIPDRCSICDGPFPSQPLQAWISLPVATDVLPLLVHACSKDCLRNLPQPPDGYVPNPHCGGLDLAQPPSRG